MLQPPGHSHCLRIYYLAKGLNKSEIGMIEGLMPIAAVCCQSAWAALADVRRSRKGVYLVTSVCGTSVLLLLGVPAIVHRSFWRILCVSVGSRAFSSAGILDAYALDVIGAKRAPKLYGPLRLWGSIGWGTGALAMGAINSMYGFGPNFVIYGLVNYARAALLCIFVPSESVMRSQRRDNASSRPDSADLIVVLTSYRLVVFLGEILVFGMAIGVVERLLFVYVVDNLNGNSLLCGLIVFVSSAFNIPVFQNAGILLAHFGKGNLMILSQFCYFTRVIGYTLLTPRTRYFILLLETLHGLTFATLWIAAVEQARQLAPDGWGATLQSLLQTTYYSLGPGLGALIGGTIWHMKSARFMYRCFAAVAFALFFLRIIFSMLSSCCKRRKSDPGHRSDSTIYVSPAASFLT